MAVKHEFWKIELLSRVISFAMTHYRSILIVLACLVLVCGVASWLEQYTDPLIALLVAVVVVSVVCLVLAFVRLYKCLENLDDSNFTPFS